MAPSPRGWAIGLAAALLLHACAAGPRPGAAKVPARGLVLLDAAALEPGAVRAPPPSPPAPAAAAPGDAAAAAVPAALPQAPAGPPDWHDDGTEASLAAAVAQSLAYYRTLPPNQSIPVGPLNYTAAELAQSLELFLTLRLTARDPAEFAEQLRRNFVVFESIAEQGDNLFTGYYEPRIRGSLAQTAEFTAPLYARPSDLVEVPLADFGKDLPRRRVMGRVQQGRLVPYYSREEIEQGGVLEGRAQPIVYVNAVDLFFLQIQGSGQVELPDGRTISVGYDASNGQPYRALGAEMIRRNLMAREDVSLFSLKRYLAEHKDIVPALLNTNPSYVFFRTRDDAGAPVGHLQVPLTPGRSLAADRLLLPPGVLAYVMTTAPVPGQIGAFQDVDRFMLIQDTGGAIRGNGRGDLFWGEGPDAEWIAGRARQPGRLFILAARKDALPPAEPAAPPAAPVPPPQALGRPLQARMP
jgi:membrane-bound lytic murein transglycosylase A